MDKMFSRVLVKIVARSDKDFSEAIVNIVACSVEHALEMFREERSYIEYIIVKVEVINGNVWVKK